MQLKRFEEFQIQGADHKQRLCFEGRYTLGMAKYPYTLEKENGTPLAFSSSLEKLVQEAKGDRARR